MAINHAIRSEAVQRFLLTSEYFLLSYVKPKRGPQQSKCCVPSLRTCVLAYQAISRANGLTQFSTELTVRSLLDGQPLVKGVCNEPE
jgi:hypothetical protein